MARHESPHRSQPCPQGCVSACLVTTPQLVTPCPTPTLHLLDLLYRPDSHSAVASTPWIRVFSPVQTCPCVWRHMVTRAHTHRRSHCAPSQDAAPPGGRINTPLHRSCSRPLPLLLELPREMSKGKVEGPERTRLPPGALPPPPPHCLLPLSYVRATLMTPENPSNATPVSGHVTT